MQLKPQSKPVEMWCAAKAHDFYVISWHLVTRVVPRHARGWGADYR